MAGEGYPFNKSDNYCSISMRRLLIVGGGSFGREVLDWALAVPRQARDWEVGGFLDSRTDILTGFDVPYPNLGAPEDFHFGDNDCFICALGDPKVKLHYARPLQARGAAFINLFHPSAIIGSGCRWGQGCIMCPGAVVSNHVTLGNFVTVNVNASVGHDAVLGDGCTLSGHADVTGFATLGEGVFLGSHAAILPKANVGEYTVVGAGSIVLKKTEPHSTVIGVPAKRVL
jgi:sugar O-acyltransferase (sialic acid O-acetyltransferase NeuD family)